jgi:hypothetical protein
VARSALAVLAAAVALLGLARPGDASAETLTLALAPERLTFGGATTASGVLTPAQPDVGIVVERRAGSGWETVAETATDSAGAFSATFEPPGGGWVRARIADAGAISPEARLSVLPSIAVRRSGGRAFLGAPLRVQIRPVTYRGRVTVSSLRGGRVVGRASGRVRDGRLRVVAPTPGIGSFRVRLRFPAAFGLEARIVKSRVRATARRLSVGSQGPDVRALHRRLAELRVHVPGLSRRYSWATFDAVLAFQKAVGLSRTGVVSAATWRALGRRRGFGPRYGKPKLHIEVDKTRQILMVVRRGRVTAVLPVSTGATGNTPEGAFRILWKAPATSTWLGPGILYRTMTFHGNFAIHGWADVPRYPASHGCVRVPIWAADWLYDRSPVGERVYVYG